MLARNLELGDRFRHPGEDPDWILIGMNRIHDWKDGPVCTCVCRVRCPGETDDLEFSIDGSTELELLEKGC